MVVIGCVAAVRLIGVCSIFDMAFLIFVTMISVTMSIGLVVCFILRIVFIVMFAIVFVILSFLPTLLTTLIVVTTFVFVCFMNLQIIFTLVLIRIVTVAILILPESRLVCESTQSKIVNTRAR